MDAPDQQHMPAAVEPDTVGGSVTYRNSLEDYLDGRRQLYGQRLWLMVGAMLLLVMLVGGVLWVQAPAGHRAALWTFLGCGLVIAVVGAPFLDRRGASAWFRGNHAAQAETTVAWDDAGLTLTNPFQVLRCPWRVVHGLRRGRRVIAINGDNGFNAFIPGDARLLAELEGRRRRALATAGRAAPAEVIAQVAAGGAQAMSGFTAVSGFRLSREQLAEAHSPLGVIGMLALALVAAEAFGLYKLSAGDPAVPAFLVAMPVIFLGVAGLTWSVSRKGLRTAWACNGDAALGHDEERVALAAHGRLDVHRWSDIATVTVRPSVIILGNAERHISLVVPNEEAFAAPIRRHLPRLAKRLAAPAG